ncbi:MAG: EamA family transporter, partial [Gaiellales bacterium]
ALTMAVAAVITAPFGDLLSAPPAPSVMLAILLLGVLPSGVAYVMYFHGVSVLGAQRAAYSNFLVPPVAILSGVIALGELPTLATLVALALASIALGVGVTGGEV